MENSKSGWKEGFLPNGERTEDVDLFVKEWNELGNSLDQLKLNMRGFDDFQLGDGTIAFNYRGIYDSYFNLPVPFVNDLKDHVKAMDLLKDVFEKVVLPRELSIEIMPLSKKWRGK